MGYCQCGVRRALALRGQGEGFLYMCFTGRVVDVLTPDIHTHHTGLHIFVHHVVCRNNTQPVCINSHVCCGAALTKAHHTRAALHQHGCVLLQDMCLFYTPLAQYCTRGHLQLPVRPWLHELREASVCQRSQCQRSQRCCYNKPIIITCRLQTGRLA